MASRDFANTGFAWRVLDDLILFEHKLIEFAFHVAQLPSRKKLTFAGKTNLTYAIRDEAWFASVQGADLSSAQALDFLLAKFYQIFNGHHRRNLRRVKSGPHKPNAWWTAELDAERKQVRKLRKSFQKTTDPEMRETLRSIFSTARTKYRNNIKEAKEAAIKRTCTDYTKRRVFGLPFKEAFHKLRPPVVLRPLRTPEGTWTVDALDSARLLLRTQVTVQAYADDTVLLIHGSNKTTFERLAHEALEKVSQWSAEAKVQVSAPKSFYLAFPHGCAAVGSPSFRVLARAPPLELELERLCAEFSLFVQRQPTCYGPQYYHPHEIEYMMNPWSVHPSERYRCAFQKLTFLDAEQMLRMPAVHVYTDGSYTQLAAGAAYVVLSRRQEYLVSGMGGNPRGLPYDESQFPTLLFNKRTRAILIRIERLVSRALPDFARVIPNPDAD
ncbi:hypothetical protein HPB52_023721 [Rhipicephalus sanguineus]|uniref:Uncharacterized protein n=1 Tax=Rhipicephalus sanguineus TaxID=34632 RepID=A0A9D4Q389_RHISA|nr:hypothetical protein HPB52_023721 [Rhipicephalus sanguineus]